MVLAAVACSLELAVSGTVPGGIAVPAMTSIHMIIGLGEALITVSIVAAVLRRPPRPGANILTTAFALRPAYEQGAIATRARRGRRVRVCGRSSPARSSSLWLSV